MENEEIKRCEHCGEGFRPLRADAKYCSDGCRKAAYKAGAKLNNLTWNGTLIRGQHVGDIAPTGGGIVLQKCACCRVPFQRWMNAKLARLVRNEIEGSVNWGSAEDFRAYHHEFEKKLAARRWEASFCSDECEKKGPKSWTEILKEQQREMTLKVQATNGTDKQQAKHRGQQP